MGLHFRNVLAISLALLTACKPDRTEHPQPEDTATSSSQPPAPSPSASGAPSSSAQPEPAPGARISDTVDFDFKLCDRLTPFYPRLGDNLRCLGILLMERRLRGARGYEDFARCLVKAATASDVDRCSQLHPRPATPSDEGLCEHIIRVTSMKLGTRTSTEAEAAEVQRKCLEGLAESRAELSPEEYDAWKNCIIVLDDYDALQRCGDD